MIQWRTLAETIRCTASGGSGDPAITGVCYDSRTVRPGALFVAVPGMKKRGAEFISAALAAGAVAVVSEEAHPELGVPWARVEDARTALGLASAAVWNVHIDAIRTVAVTGTNGKTTTATLLRGLLGAAYGRDAWLFSTIGYFHDGVWSPAPNTTPESADIFRMIGTARRQPVAIAMEASSHALALRRIAGFSYDVAVWTNLTQDHLDFHGTMEEYYLAKRTLFTGHLKKDGVAVVNIDDPWGKRLVSELPGVPAVTYGEDSRAAVRICGWSCDWDGSRLTVRTANAERVCRSKLTGSFNRYNIAAMCAAAQALAIGPDTVQAALDELESVPGRIERVCIPAGYAVAVDYAHTPDALDKVLETARALTRGRLLCVFGCGGDRDRTKRPLMAAAVARGCDEAIITSDNPRTEKPGAIIEETRQGMPLDFPYRVIEDRRAAIRAAMTMARDGDCVIVAGKGHEDYQEIMGVRHHFDDRETVREIYAELAVRHD